MANNSKRLGTLFETACVAVLKSAYWTHAERRTLQGNKDRGDISGVHGMAGPVVIEVKNCGKLDLPGWLSELAAEMVNDTADVGFVWVKKRGKASALDGYAVLHPAVLLQLLHRAGYSNVTQDTPPV